MAQKTKDTNIGIKVAPIKEVRGAYKYTKSDWTMVAYVLPRKALYQKITEKELQYNSIYFLLGREGITDMAYVGQAKERNGGGSVLVRLREHADSQTEVYRDIWDDVIVITSSNGDWGATELNALENIFYNEIKANSRLNGNEPNKGGINIEIDYEEKVRQTKAFFNFIGINVFNDSEESEQIHILEVEEPEEKVVGNLRSGIKRIAEIITPRKEVKKMVNEIPYHMFNPDTVFFDQACKGGEFLKEIYNRLMETESLIALFPDPIMRAMHILDKQLFGIALSQESLDRANRSLYGYADARKNIRIINNYIEILKNKSKKDDVSIKDILDKEFGRDMKVDVIIGNPPYNDIKNGGGSETNQNSKQLYTYFVEKGLELNPCILELIIPCRWYTESDKEYVSMRDSLSDGHLQKIVDYPNSKEVFDEVSIVGGVCYFIYNVEHNGLCDFQSSEVIDSIELKSGQKIIRYKEMRDIVNKVDLRAEKTLDTKVSTTAPFGFKRADRGSVIPTDYFNIKLISAEDETYVNIEEIEKNVELVSKYNVYVGYTQALNDGVLSSLGILKPNEVCTLTYLILDSFNTLEEAENCLKYMKTRFVRALIKAITSTLGVTAKNYSLVPLQDFTSNSDIDWSQSVNNIEHQLYAKYSLSQEEISYIESTIKTMS